MNGDGVPDIVVGTGPGGGPHVRVLDGRTGAELFSFFAYEPGFTGGVFVAAGDVNGDGRADIITGPGPGGGPHVRVFDGATGLPLSGPLAAGFLAYAPGFAGGVSVAAGDVNGDGFADIITGPGPGGAPEVRVFDGFTGRPLLGGLGSFLPYAPGFAGGVFVAAGDVNGDGRADIITGVGPGGASHVRVFDGFTGNQLPGAIGSFLAYDPGFRGGVLVGAADVNGDGRADVVTGVGLGGGPDVRVFDAVTGAELTGFFAYDPAFRGGVFVAGSPR